MNNLSFLLVRYMESYIIGIMRENPSILKKENLSWRDIQELSWTFGEFSFELNNEFSTYACT